MTLCALCGIGKRDVVCRSCHNKAIEDLTIILEDTQAQLRLEKMKNIFLQPMPKGATVSKGKDTKIRILSRPSPVEIQCSKSKTGSKG